MEKDIVRAPEMDFKEEEQRALRARMWALLKNRALWETMGDASSLRVEQAEELLRSIAFTLDVYLQRTGTDRRALLSGDLNALLLKGQDLLAGLVQEASALYNEAQCAVCDFGNLSLRDTLRGIGLFFARYQLLSYAHQIPADIDYQLAQPVSEATQGVLYIREYLRRLLFENAFLARFAQTDVHAVLHAYYGDYREPLVNLFEPVAACALGLSALEGGVRTLFLGRAQLLSLEKRFQALDDVQARALLDQAALRVLTRLELLNPFSLDYLKKTAHALLPRIRAAQSLSGVFPLSGEEDGK